MFDPNIGHVFILIGGLSLIVAAAYGLGPLLFRSRAATEGGSIRIRESDFFPGLTPTEPYHPPTVEVAPGEPTATPRDGSAGDSPASYDESLVSELFAEVFAVRTAIGELSSDLRSLRSAWEKELSRSVPAARPALDDAPLQEQRPAFDEAEAYRWAA